MAAASATTRRFREAAEARDVDALLATLSEDVVLRSPITDRITFRGRAQLGELMQSVFATIEAKSSSRPSASSSTSASRSRS